jgi:hypothetical protein
LTAGFDPPWLRQLSSAASICSGVAVAFIVTLLMW